MSKTHKKIGVLIWAVLGVAAVQAAMPVPVVKDGVAVRDAAAMLNDGEATAGLYIKFDALPSHGNPVDFFEVSADEEGRVTVTMPAERGDLIGDMPFVSKARVRPGEWHHLAFAFSRQQRRFAFWLDGELQFENNMQWLPKVDFSRVKQSPRAQPKFLGLFGGTEGFDGEVRGFTMYDASLPSACVKPAQHLAQDAAKAKALLADAAKAKNGNLAAYAKAIIARVDAALAAGEASCERTMEELLRDAANAKRMAAENGDTAGVGAVMTTDLLDQEMVLPYVLPKCGAFSGKVEVACAKDESETASVVVMAYKPLHQVKLTLSDLVAKDGSIVKADTVDMKLVKRIYCTGGAWMTYHRDPRLRILTPCLMLNDDTLYKVDEFKCRHAIRIDYPKEEGGSVYADVTDPDAPVQVFGKGVPFNDAKTLLPLDIPEAGRNQQFTLCFRAGKDAKPGTYRGTLAITSREGEVGRLAVAFRVLPFTLPQPKSYEDLNRAYISDVNGIRMDHIHKSPRTWEERVGQFRDIAKNCLEHNVQHLGGLWASATSCEIGKELGFDTTYLFEACSGTLGRHLGIGKGDWRDFYACMAKMPEYQDALAKIPDDDAQPGRKQFCPKYYQLIGNAEKEKAFALMKRQSGPRLEMLKKVDPKATPMAIYWSESAAFVRLGDIQRQEADFAHTVGAKVFAHGHNVNAHYAATIQDMNSASGNMDRDIADKWHAAGGSVFSYCMPFPSSENPAMHRRWNGLERYKTFRYDGSMQHGLITNMYDEFRDDPGGDGNYRNFAVAYQQQLGVAWTIAWEGWREAFDDVRYATLLKQLCTPHLEDANLNVRGEAKRCLVWLNNVDGTYTDMNAFRAGVTWRILNFQNVLASAKEGR